MFRSFTTIVATLAVSGFASAQDAVQWTEAEGGNGHWYQLVTQPGGIAWSNANTLADSSGGYLATLTGEEENTFVLNAIDNSGSIQPWIGLYQDTEADDYSEPLGGWRWVTGEAYDWTNWNLTEPTDGGVFGSENEVNIWLSGSGQPLGTWNDYRDDLPDGYVVEYSADCNGDGIVDYGQILDGSLTDENGNGIPDCCEENNCFTSAVQWEIENGGNGHWYERIDDPDTWSAASDYAQSIGAHLLSINSSNEDSWAYEQLNGDTCWIGAWQDINDIENYSEPDGGWRWTSNEPWIYTNWNGGGPDNNGFTNDPFEEYGAYCCDGKWNDTIHVDTDGTITLKPYIIEWSADCNDDGIVDYGQILDGTLEDLDGNGIPDCCDQGYACFPPDCNGNGIDDAIDLGNGTSPDCNTNGIPDECDLANGESEDCNANGTPDQCESLGDCDGDGTPDVCEILNGAIDANPADGIPDECQGLPVGACCIGGKCVLTSLAQCFQASGAFAGEGITCAQANCPQQCDGDTNGDSVVNITDLLILLAAYGNHCP